MRCRVLNVQGNAFAASDNTTVTRTLELIREQHGLKALPVRKEAVDAVLAGLLVPKMLSANVKGESDAN